MDLARGHAEAGGELAPCRRVGLVGGPELFLEDLNLSKCRTLSVLDIVRAVVVKCRKAIARDIRGRMENRALQFRNGDLSFKF